MSEQRSLVSGDKYLGGLLTFVYRTLRKRLFLVALSTLAVMIIAYFAAERLPPVYGAQASLRVGQMDGSEIVSQQAAAARINSQSFKQSVVKAMYPAVDDRSAQLIAGSLSARPETSETIVVSVRAPISQQVRRALETTVQLLNEEEEKRLKPFVADIKSRLVASDANIAGLVDARESLASLTKAISEPQSGDQVSVTLRRVWLSDIVSRNEARLVEAMATRRALADRLDTRRTYPTALVDEVFVPPTPVFPQPLMIAVLAGGFTFLGLLLYGILRGQKIPRAN